MARSALAAALLLSGSAQAEVIRIARPHYHPVAPAGPAPIRGAATAPECLDGAGRAIVCQVDMRYFGGRVLSNVKAYAVLWKNGTDAVDPAIASGIGGFFQTVVDSPWMDWQAEYSTRIAVEIGSRAGLAGTQQLIGRGTFAGSYTLVPATAYPACASPDQALTCISDRDVATEIDAAVGRGDLPAPDANTLYLVYFPASIRIADPGATSCVQYCAYHGSYLGGGGQGVPYAVIPDLAHNGCQNGCGGGTAFQNACETSSHELAEAMTDADVGLAAAVDYPLAWYDASTPSQGEVGDMCNGHADTVGPAGPGCTLGTPGCYAVQQEFSRQAWNASGASPTAPACVSSRTAAVDHAVALRPGSLALRPNGDNSSSPIAVETAATSGGSSPLTLAVAAAPPGVHAVLDATSILSGQTAHLTLFADPTALVKDGVVVVEAAGAALHSASLLLQVSGTPVANDWSISIPAGTTVLLPTAAAPGIAVSTARVSGSAETIALAVSGLPPGVSGTFSPTSVLAGGSATLDLISSGASPVAAASFTVTGTSASQPGGHGASALVQVNGLPGAAIASPPDGATVSGTVAVKGSAGPGANATLQGAVLRIDGAERVSSPGGSIDFAWNTAAETEGPHAVELVARDVDGGSSTAAIAVTVARLAAAPRESSGCGCSSPGGSAWELLALLPALGLRRRIGARPRGPPGPPGGGRTATPDREA